MMKGISRINKKSPGWFVRIYRHGKTYSHFFSDAKNGGKEQGFERAKKYLEELNNKIPPIPRKRYLTHRLPNNTSGRNGVSESYAIWHNQKVGRWNVSWNDPPGHPHSRSFYFRTQDERQKQYEKAVSFRKKKELEIGLGMTNNELK